MKNVNERPPQMNFHLTTIVTAVTYIATFLVLFEEKNSAIASGLMSARLYIVYTTPTVYQRKVPLLQFGGGGVVIGCKGSVVRGTKIIPIPEIISQKNVSRRHLLP